MSQVANNIHKLLNEFSIAHSEIENEVNHLYQGNVLVESEEDDVFVAIRKLYRVRVLLTQVLKDVLAEEYSSKDALRSLEKIDLLTSIEHGTKHGDHLTRFLREIKN